MTIEELLLRKEAQTSRDIDILESFYQFAFINRAVNSVDSSGETYQYSNLKEIADFDSLRQKLNSEAQESKKQESDELLLRSQRVNSARLEAIKTLEERG